MVVDVGAITREFDYVVPTRWTDRVGVGTMVRVPLHGRRVPGWVVALDTEPPSWVKTEAVTKVSGCGPSAEVIDLARWAAWRWAGRLPHFLGAASPDTMVPSIASTRRRAVALPTAPEMAGLFDGPRATFRLPPAGDPLPVVLAAVARGDSLVVCPTMEVVRQLMGGLRRAGVSAVSYPDGWPAAAAGTTVVGTRRAIFAPMPALRSIVVIDEHDEALQNEGSPTWHAREVAFERGRRHGVPVVLTSPCPTLEATRRAPLQTVSRTAERQGWATIETVDRRNEDVSQSGLFTSAAVRAFGGEGRVVCVLNRTGRAGLLSCGACRTVAACERCGASVFLDDERRLVCRQCADVRPLICASCGATAMRQLRLGVTRAREELEALIREPVSEITATRRSGSPACRVVIGTEAVFHQVVDASVVVFLDFDQELLAPRYRASEHAMALLAAASKLVGGRQGRIVVQTRTPDDPVLAAAIGADPSILSEREDKRRHLLELPPAMSVAVVGGQAGEAFMAVFEPPADARVDRGPSGESLIRCADRAVLLDALAEVTRPSGRLRLWIDPLRLPT